MISLEQREYMELNRAFWSEDAVSSSVSKAFVLADAAGKRPATYLSNAALAGLTSRAMGHNPLFLVKSMKDEAKIQVLKSFPGAEFINLSLPRYQRMRWIANIHAALAYRKFKTPKDILNFACDDIAFGDSIHDEVLAMGYASIDCIDHRLLKVLQRFYYLRFVIQDILKSYDIRIALFAHTIGLYGAVLSRYCLKRHIEILHRVGSYQIILSKYRELKDLGSYVLTPPREFFERMKQNKAIVLAEADLYFKKRFAQEVIGGAVQSAYDPSLKTYTDKDNFCQKYNLDSSKPIVFVMLHAFNDYPHSHFYEKPIIFQDYADWFLRTLDVARKNTEVNWIFKEHPSNRHYVTKDLDLDDLFSKVNESHIQFLSYQADFNTKSLVSLAHSIITCIGPAGLEYSVCGIPCILGGGSGYHGFGFTEEPKDLKEYETALLNIAGLERLNENQVETAKMVAYFYFHVMQGQVFSFCPVMDAHEVWKWDQSDEKNYWTQAVKNLQDPDMVKAMRDQKNILSEFILDVTQKKYYDKRRFSFLGEISESKSAEVAE